MAGFREEDEELFVVELLEAFDSELKQQLCYFNKFLASGLSNIMLKMKAKR